MHVLTPRNPAVEQNEATALTGRQIPAVEVAGKVSQSQAIETMVYGYARFEVKSLKRRQPLELFEQRHHTVSTTSDKNSDELPFRWRIEAD